jgi:hypothetical protein
MSLPEARASDDVSHEVDFAVDSPVGQWAPTRLAARPPISASGQHPWTGEIRLPSGDPVRY